MTVRIPHSFRVRGSSKLVIVPHGAPAWAPTRPKPNNAILKALGQSWRWKKIIDSGEYATLAELAKAKRVNFSYTCRVVRLALLPPELIKKLLNGISADIKLHELLRLRSFIWVDHEAALNIPANNEEAQRGSVERRRCAEGLVHRRCCGHERRRGRVSTRGDLPA